MPDTRNYLTNIRASQEFAGQSSHSYHWGGSAAFHAPEQLQPNHEFRLSSAPHTKLPAFLDIFQPLTLLRLYTKSNKIIRFCAFTLVAATEQKISISVVLIPSQYCRPDENPRSH